MAAPKSQNSGNDPFDEEMKKTAIKRNQVDEEEELEEDPLDQEDEDPLDQNDPLDNEEENSDDEENLPDEELDAVEEENEEEADQPTPQKTFEREREMGEKPPQSSSVFGGDDLDDSGPEDAREEQVLEHASNMSHQDTDNSLDDLANRREEEIVDLTDEKAAPFASQRDFSEEIESSEDDFRSSEHSDVAIPHIKHHIPQSGVYSSEGAFNRPNQAQQVFRGAPPERKRGGSKWQFLILAIVGLSVIGATVYLLKNNFTGTSSQTVPSPTPEPTATPVPTPTPIPVDKSKIKVRVLNGTGRTGLAATVMEKLEGLGYQKDRTGNATTSAFPQTVVRVKPDQASISAALIQDLSPDYSAVESTPLKGNEAFDAEIILGLK